MQDSFIFSGTIMDNIRYGRLDATDDEVIEAAKRFMRMSLSWRWKRIPDRGQRARLALVMGQKQLISFAERC